MRQIILTACQLLLQCRSSSNLDFFSKNLNLNSSFIDSRLTKKGRKRNTSKKFWDEGWIDEVEHKLNRREIEMLKDERKMEMKTKNKLIMDYLLEHVEVRNGNIEDLRKINRVKKHKRVMTPHELLGSSRVTLTTRGKEINEVSSTRYRPARCVANREIKHKKRIKRVVKCGVNLCNG